MTDEQRIARAVAVATSEIAVKLCAAGERRTGRPRLIPLAGVLAAYIFHATGEPPAKKSEALAARNGELAVEPQRNGPLKVTGNLEVVSGTGHTIDRVTETWLCRCGHSQNKPFCDGSHRKFGFEADGA